MLACHEDITRPAEVRNHSTSSTNNDVELYRLTQQAQDKNQALTGHHDVATNEADDAGHCFFQRRE